MNRAAINTIDKEKCTGCFGCYNACAYGAIEMVLDKEGFIIPKIDEKKCKNCGLCQEECPVINKNKINNYQAPKVYGAWNKDEKIRISSSSGGIFTELSKIVLNKSGVVFGVTFDKSYTKAKHVLIKNEAELNRLRGSKYIQSYVGKSYQKAIDIANSGRKVLFSGTPCQIASLNLYLKNNRPVENIITCEVVCHGVPSQSIFVSYLDCLQKKYNSALQGFNFRDKRFGWENYGTSILFGNNNFFRKNKEDLFMRGYLKRIYLRKSCYDCPFSKIPRGADITLGDFWGIRESGIENIRPEEIKKGISVILVNSDKGLALFKEAKNIEKFETSMEHIKKFNPRIDVSRYELDINKREKFYKLMNKCDFETAVKKCIAPTGNIIKFFRYAIKKAKTFLN